MFLIGEPIPFLIQSTGRLPALFLAVWVHEAAHAWMARRAEARAGAEPTAEPFSLRARLDPVGLIGFLVGYLGWCKSPALAEQDYLRPRRGSLLILAAGPAANLAMAVVSGLAFRVILPFSKAEALGVPPGWMEASLTRLVLTLIILALFSLLTNLLLCIFNLIPIYPLDGEQIFIRIMPARLARRYERLRRYGPSALLSLILLLGPQFSATLGRAGTSVLRLLAGIGFYECKAVIDASYLALWGHPR